MNMEKQNKSPVVTVVLCTFNGEKFLPEQLSSLASQTRRPDRLVLRDDGSSDASVAIVEKWAHAEGIALQQIMGPRLGPAHNFLVALQAASLADVYLFCDQDDVWREDKIERALQNVPWDQKSGPVLCATRLAVVDENLEPIRLSFLPKHLAFDSAVYESLLTGCTMAFNAKFRDTLIRMIPPAMVMHDWWCYLVATGVAGVTLRFDTEPLVLYRQHSNNAMGAKLTGLADMHVRLSRFFGTDSALRSRQLMEFAALYEVVLSPAAANLLHTLLGAKSSLLRRIWAVYKLPVQRQTFLATLTTRLAVLTNRF